MFGNHIQAVDLMKTYYFATGPEIAGRLCVSSVCMPCTPGCVLVGVPIMFAGVHVRISERVLILFPSKARNCRGAA